MSPLSVSYTSPPRFLLSTLRLLYSTLIKMASADHTRDPWYVLCGFAIGQLTNLFTAHGSSSTTSEVLSQWVRSVVPSGTASRVQGTHHECVVLISTLTQSNIVQGERFPGAISSIKARAPVTGGNFGIWGGMFSTFDCAVKGYRQKEDAWNAIISGFMTGGCLALRSMSGRVITCLGSKLTYAICQAAQNLR